MEIRLVAKRKRMEEVSRFNAGLMKVALKELKKLSEDELSEVLQKQTVSEYINRNFQMGKNNLYTLYNIYLKRGYKDFPPNLTREEFFEELKNINEAPEYLIVKDANIISPIINYVDDFNKEASEGCLVKVTI